MFMFGPFIGHIAPETEYNLSEGDKAKTVLHKSFYTAFKHYIIHNYLSPPRPCLNAEHGESDSNG